MTLVINLYGGPGTGKSTTAAAVFVAMKNLGWNCELVTEFAKDKVWERSTDVLDNQIYIMGKQYHRLWRLKDQVDYIVTDSPILLSLIYGKKESQAFAALVKDLYGRFNNLDIFLYRSKPYNPRGRLQTEEEAKALDGKILEMLNKEDITYKKMPADLLAPEDIIGLINAH